MATDRGVGRYRRVVTLRYGWGIPLREVVMTLLQEHQQIQSELRQIRKKLVTDGACPFDIAAAALAMADRLQRENRLLKAELQR